MSLFKRRAKPQTLDEEFDVVVRQLIKKMTPSGSELVETGNDSIMVAGGQTYLGNLRKGWTQQQPGERYTWLRDAVHGIFLSQLQDQSTLDLSMLRPGLRSEWYLNAAALGVAVQQGSGTWEHGVAHRSVGPGLVRVLLWDTPTTMALITDGQIKDWGSDFDQLWDVAVQNLAADPAEQGWGLANDCCWTPLSGDDYTAERMFIDGHLDMTGLTGDVVMFHPNRQTLILADPDDAAGIALAAQIAMSRATDANPITLIPYIGRGLSWRPLTLPANHLAADAVNALRLGELSNTYAQQKELLTAIYDDDIFVASYTAFQVDERTVTIASWTEGAATLLPRTDLISFVHGLDDEPEVVTVDWDHATEIIGARLEPTNHWPERWRVTSFPSPSELDQLRSIPALN